MLLAQSSQLGIETYIRDYARPGVILDVGGYLGGFTKNVMENVGFSKAYIYEPNPNNLVELRQRFTAPGPVTIVPRAVGSVACNAVFHFGSDPTTGSLLPVADHTANLTSFEVEVTTLDTEIFGGKISVIKIDTQGGDLDVLKGAEKLIAHDQPIVIVELIFAPLYDNQASPFDIMQWLGARGYAMAGFYNEHYGDGWLAFADAIFIPNTVAPAAPSRFEAVPERGALESEIEMLRRVCAERLDLINQLDSDLRRATGVPERSW